MTQQPQKLDLKNCAYFKYLECKKFFDVGVTKFKINPILLKISHRCLFTVKLQSKFLRSF